MSIVWLSVFIVFVFIELMTINLVSIWFAIGALLTCFLSLIITDVMIQLAIFTITSLITLLLTKKLVKKVRNRKVIPTNLDQVIGKIGLVTSDIDKLTGGEVKVLGKCWSAMSDSNIKKDSKVKILAIDGVKLKVVKESD